MKRNFRKISYLIVFLLIIGVFNLHFGVKRTCEQVDHFECGSMSAHYQSNGSQEESCCSSKSDSKPINENFNQSFGDCHCFHLLEYETELINSDKPTQFSNNLQVIAQIDLLLFNNKPKNIFSELYHFEYKTIPIILRTESFLI